jgi:putative colanic acid biosysnthesis UDP-glucose lipid carrier transferase
MNPSIERTAVIIGCNAASVGFAKNLLRNRQHAIRVLGFFDDRSQERLDSIGDLPLLGPLSALDQNRRDGFPAIDVIVVALPQCPRIMRVLEAMRDTPVSIYYLPDAFTLDLVHSRIENLGGLPLLELKVPGQRPESRVVQ